MKLIKAILSVFGVKLITGDEEAARIYAIIAAIDSERDEVIAAMNTATDRIAEVLNREN